RESLFRPWLAPKQYPPQTSPARRGCLAKSARRHNSGTTHQYRGRPGHSIKLNLCLSCEPFASLRVTSGRGSKTLLSLRVTSERRSVDHTFVMLSAAKLFDAPRVSSFTVLRAISKQPSFFEQTVFHRG